MKTLRRCLPLAAILLWASAAHAQDGQPDRFFSDKVGEAEAQGEAPEDTLFQGSLTSSTFAYTESGDTAADDPANLTDNASPVSRLYTDVRAQLDAKHIAGSGFTARVDGRIRLASSCDLQSGINEALYGTCRTQSGLYGDNEYDLRELYVRRLGSTVDLKLGRQYVFELAATKIDGVRVDYLRSDRLSFLGFAGLYPARGSRSINEDYPTPVINGMAGDRVLPLAGGLGSAYRYQSVYGSFGAVAIAPLAQELSGADEPVRFFVTSNGYWRQSRKLDLYHFAVVDLQGAGGSGLTNLSAGFNFRPSSTLRVTAGLNHVDTETLNVIAQNRLEDTNAQSNLLQNNIDVTRVSSDSLRVAVSAALREQRFEVTASGQLRRRPDITLIAGDGVTVTAFEEARAAEVMLSVVDRRSFKDFRLGASVLRIFGLGDPSYARSQVTMVRAYGSREFRGGRGQYELDLSYLSSQDDSNGMNCASGVIDPINCFGSTSVGTLGLTGTGFYRFKTDWFVTGSATAARQGFTTRQGAVETAQSPNLLLSAFLRVAYRF